MQSVLREEKKFLIHLTQFYTKSSHLSKLLMEDSHNHNDGYMIRSLYFDTVYDTDFFEKDAGVELRRKIRLRIYDTESLSANLEMKQKQGSKQLKRSLKISREHAMQMCKGNYSCLLTYKDPFAKEMYAYMNMKCYRPKTIVEYKRKAFIAKENKIRITFDHSIVSTESNFNIFDSNLLMYPVLDPDNVVLEVKFNGFLLSYIKDMIETVNSSELSVSKYCLARQHGYHTNL